MRKLKFEIKRVVADAIVEIEDDSLSEADAIELAEDQLANADWCDDPCYGVTIYPEMFESEPDVIYKGIQKDEPTVDTAG